MALVKKPGTFDGLVCLNRGDSALQDATNVRPPSAHGAGSIADVCRIEDTTKDFFFGVGDDFLAAGVTDRCRRDAKREVLAPPAKEGEGHEVVLMSESPGHSRVDVTISSDFSHHQTLSGRNNERATGYPAIGSFSPTRSRKVAGFGTSPSLGTFVVNLSVHLASGVPAPPFRTPFPITYHAAGAGSERLHDIRYFRPVGVCSYANIAFVSTSHQKVVLELDFAGALWVSSPLCWRAAHDPHITPIALRDTQNCE